uniref:NADH-ubiquinone oxidoreductase chain 2 n=1 Tax=Haemaphysalis montgomeryi TaxID=1429820 RepID=A0A8E5UYG7_9ACAR|nr:NADH dehydrogenase subunit 2 [Haemaphysalis montgomeryi]QVJ97815.1 NADH dehydrogenase subunit 2 [Haemaphysalis montgomeryi]
MFFKNLMKWMIMISIIISISSNNWFIFWIMMEMNMMVFIPIMKNNKMENCNSMITYFIIQSFSSIMFFMASSIMIFNYSLMNDIFINISLLIKLSMIPFHFWLISISEILDLNSFLVIITMQKIIPLFILYKMKTTITFYISILSLICSSIMIFNLKTFKKILIFSSISHLSWMIIIMFSCSNFWIFYMMIYFIMIMAIVKMIQKNNINSIFDLMKSKISNLNKINMIISLMSLGGMPPFMGFMIKFMAISIIIKYSMVSMTILIMSSLINIFIYIRMITPILISFKKIHLNLNITKLIKNLIMNLMIIISFFLMNLIF